MGRPLPGGPSASLGPRRAGCAEMHQPHTLCLQPAADAALHLPIEQIELPAGLVVDRASDPKARLLEGP
eukprot:2037367-Lingulodinium_polyedra.AAC.1